MKNLTILTILLVFLASLTACGGGGDTSTSTNNPQGRGDLWGWITDGDTNSSLAGAKVSCAGISDITVNDSDGFGYAYHLDNLPAGSQIITVTLDGYGSYSAYVDVIANESTLYSIKLYSASKTKDFASAEEFMENPSIQTIISDQNFPIYWDTSPPSLEGSYYVSGYVSDSNLSNIIEQPLSSSACLFNQTNLGLIDYTETTSGISVTTSGNYITGSNSSFTIWQEGDADVGGCEVHNAIILSGTMLSGGDLDIESLTINLSQNNCEAYTIPEWYEAISSFTLNGSCSGDGA